MTLPRIGAFLKSHNLSLLGFELDDAVLDAYRISASRTTMPPPPIWVIKRAFEREHPGMFAGMYEFWIWKAP